MTSSLELSALRVTLCLVLPLSLTGCPGEDLPIEPPADAGSVVDSGTPDAGPAGLPILGNFKHASSSVQLTEVVSAAAGLNFPRDLAFNPAVSGQLWVVNQKDDSMVIVTNAGGAGQTSVKRSGDGSSHFMPRPAALAFGAPNRMATIHDTDLVTQPFTPGDFMGPSLWPTDSTFEGGHISHQDMLHNSPLATGIAWDHDNIYWVFDGYHQSITRYDFKADHGPGGNDHSDGDVRRYVQGQVAYVASVSSHMELDRNSGLLYIADTGNRRIAVLDTRTGTAGAAITPNYDYDTQVMMMGASLTTLVRSGEAPLVTPSGLALHEGTLYVSDNELSRIYAYDLTGKVLDWLDLSAQVQPGGLMGIDFDPQGRLYVVDAVDNRVLRVAIRVD
jgi:sugar lactone lactonase YvrE